MQTPPPVIDAHAHCGINWHRHPDEPVCACDAPRCRKALAEAGLWSLENVWSDTDLAGPGEICRYIQPYGHRRLMFGSDFPFGDPFQEMKKVRRLQLAPAVEKAVLGGNFIRLQAGIDTRADRSAGKCGLEGHEQ